MNNRSEMHDGTNLRVAVLFYRVGPYHFARLRAAGRQMRVTVVEYSNVDPFYAWDEVAGQEGFERVTLFKGVSVEQQSAKNITTRVRQVLSELRPEVVAVPGWHDCCALAALKWCYDQGVPTVVMSETTPWDFERKWWKEAVKQRIVRCYSTALVGGTPHKDYMVQLGMPAERVFLGYDAVDNDYFAAKTQEVRSQSSVVRGQSSGKGLQDYETTGPQDRRSVVSSQSSVVRSRYGLLEKYFLASARFVEQKNLPRLIEAYARYRQLAAATDNGLQDNGTKPSDYGTTRLRGSQSSVVGGPCPVVSSPVVPWSLVLLGDGPLRETLNSQLSTLNLHDHVLLPGFKQYGELPAYYGLAKAFIHASTTEPWGLVVNEGIGSGLPVLVSNRCGCAADLVQEGRNGFTFDPYNVEEIAQLMLKISAFNFPLSEFGLMSREIISAWGPERFAQGLCAASEQALKGGAKRAMIFDRLLLMSLSRRPSPTNSTTSVGASHSMKHSKISDKEAVQQFFTATALDYSKLFLSKRSGSNFGFRERLALAVQMTAGISGSLLDCACGTGEITTAIVNSGRFARATIIDLSPRMLEIARQQMETGLKGHKLDQLKLISSDIFEFAAQTGAGRYDLILCLGLIAHTGRLDCLLSRLKGLLAPDGKILLQSTLLDHLGTKVVRALTQERYYHRQGYRISFFRHQDILQVAREVGLESVAVKRFTVGFPFGDRFWAGMNYRLEQRMQNWAKLHGAEAMYLLQHNSHEP